MLPAVLEMKSKWMSYYKHIPDICLVAFVLDPRFKIDGLMGYLSEYYTYLGCNDPLDVDNFVDVDAIVSYVRRLIDNLWHDYSVKFGTSSTRRQGNEDTDEVSSSRAAGDGSAAFRLIKNLYKRPRASTNTELDLFLNSPTLYCEPANAESVVNYNILGYWGDPSVRSQYPILSMVARDVVAAPMSTVAVEQAFSKGGNILEERRCSLSPESLEAQTCLADWTRPSYRTQESMVISDPDTDDFFSTDGYTTAGTAGSTAVDDVDDD